MKFIHTADWHLGKLVHGVYMTEQQRYVLKQLIEVVAEEQPDALIIAGDLYDRSVPPTEAVKLLEETLFTINVELETPILAISGNHDSPERLSFGSSWYRHTDLYIQGKIEDMLKPVQINDVHFYLVPYAEPGMVREFFQEPGIQSHDAAMRRIVGEIEESIDHRVHNIFIGHAFVLGGVTSDSERTLSVGGTGCVSGDCFSPFAYTALGHLHSPHAIRHETIRYSGSLLKYSFSEVNHRKSISIIEMDSDGKYSMREEYLTPELDMREIKGYLEELLDPNFYHSQKVDDYLKISLLDEGALIDPINKLRQVYPNVLHLERHIDQVDLKNKQAIQTVQTEHKTELEMFSDFYAEMTTLEFTEREKEIMKDIIDSVRKEAVFV